MLWSQNMPDGSPGLAAWDIFRAEDSDKVRWASLSHRELSVDLNGSDRSENSSIAPRHAKPASLISLLGASQTTSEWLRDSFASTSSLNSLDSPIHVQGTFLNSTLRAQLLKEEGVKSFRIWQRPGQVVFIPAG